jgi:hypothetical protein
MQSPGNFYALVSYLTLVHFRQSWQKLYKDTKLYYKEYLVVWCIL